MPRLRYNLDEISNVMVEPGKYKAKLMKCEQTLSKASQNPMLVFTWQILDKPYQGKEMKSYASLLENALGNLKNHLEGLGLKGKVDTDTAKLLGRTAYIIVSLRERTGEHGETLTSANITNILALSSSKSSKAAIEEDEDEEEEDVEEEEEDEEEEPAPKAKAKRKAAPPPEDDEDEEEDEEDDEDDADDEDDGDEDEPAPKARRQAKPVARGKAAPAKSAKKSSRKSDLPF